MLRLAWGWQPSSDCGWRRHWPWIESALEAEYSPDTFCAKSVRSSIYVKGYTHQEASLSQPPAPSTPTAVIRSEQASQGRWIIHTDTYCLQTHTHTIPYKQMVIQRDSRAKLWQNMSKSYCCCKRKSFVCVRVNCWCLLTDVGVSFKLRNFSK